jgi:hypothetical protein
MPRHSNCVDSGALIYIERRPFKITRRGCLQCRQIHIMSAELYDGDMFSCSEVCYCCGPFLVGWKYAEDARRTRRHSDFGIHLRIQTALEETPLASIRCTAEARRTPASTAFHILTNVPGLRFRDWRWLPQRVSAVQEAIGTHASGCPGDSREAKAGKSLDY